MSKFNLAGNPSDPSWIVYVPTFLPGTRVSEPVKASEPERKASEPDSDLTMWYVGRLPLRKSIGGGAAAATEAPKKPVKKPRKVASGQKEMLMPIAGKKPAKEAAAKKPAAKPQRKSA